MAKKEIVFKLLAYSDAAGKYNPDAPLNGNEDNFYVDDDLSDDIPGRCQMDRDVIMSDCGCLMVVADGMGGMNAGEVASDIAISTVKEYFAPGKISPKMAVSSVERRRYLEQVIKDADRRVKTDAKENPEHEGMGSTIILAWVVRGKVTISWCGDSRAYRFNPINGLELLSRDHSYVQELVNQGALTYEDTFEHPQGNIVTRSLGDPNNAAKPETREFDVYNDDIILLCSDGLSGVLRDRKTKDHNGNYYPGENIEDIIAAHTASLTECREVLMDAAEKADWYDNVTVLLCQIKSGGEKAPKRKLPSVKTAKTVKTVKFPVISKRLRKKLLLCAGGGLVAILCGVFYCIGLHRGSGGQDNNDAADSDSAAVVLEEVINVGGALPSSDTTSVERPSEQPKPQPQPVGASKSEWKSKLQSKLKTAKEAINDNTWKSDIDKISGLIDKASDDAKGEYAEKVENIEKCAQYLRDLENLKENNRNKKDDAERLEKNIIGSDITQPLDHDLIKEIKGLTNELTETDAIRVQYDRNVRTGINTRNDDCRSLQPKGI